LCSDRGAQGRKVSLGLLRAQVIDACRTEGAIRI
jgi:hypothetical protein